MRFGILLVGHSVRNKQGRRPGLLTRRCRLELTRWVALAAGLVRC